MSVAALLLLVFAADMVIKFPFGGAPTFLTIDIMGALAGAVLLYLSWSALKDLL